MSRISNSDLRAGFAMSVLREGYRIQAPTARLLVTALIVGIAYYVGVWVGFTTAFPGTESARRHIFWPPNVVLLAAMLVTPARRWWPWLVAAFAAHLVAHVQLGVAPGAIALPVQFAGNVVQAVVAAVMLRRLNDPAWRLDTLRSMVAMIAAAGIVVPALVSALVIYVYVWAGWMLDFASAWHVRFLANSVSTITLAPLLFIMAGSGLQGLRELAPHRVAEFIAVFTGLLVVGTLVSRSTASAAQLPLLYAPLPFLLWTAVRFGPPGLSISLVATLLLFVSPLLGGPSVTPVPADNTLSLANFLMAIAVPLMLLAALMQERRRAEEQLAESEQRHRLAVTAGSVSVWDWDLDCGRISVDPVLKRTLGYSEEEIPDNIEAWTVHVPAQDIARMRAAVQAHLNGATVACAVEHRMLHRDGSVRWFDARGAVSTRRDGRAVRMIGTVTDITERKRAENALFESEERLRLTLEAGQMGVWDWDKHANALTWSKEHFTIMGLAPFSVQPTYKVWADCVHPEDLPRAEAAMERAVAERREYRCEYRVLLFGAGIRWVEARGTPVYGEREECVRVRGLIADVTDRKRSEQELRNALVEVQQLRIKLEADNVYLREEVSQTHRCGEMIGESKEIKKVFKQVEQVAPTEMTVLILGETGTGKELVARALHAQGSRNQRPLIKVNCAALPAELIESELFGHEKGAFTGAVARRIGRFELADGGTIFLDEVGELSLGLQPKLLRVLQEGEFERVGSGKTIKVDVRVIAATNRSLLQAVHDGRFRADLYYRLSAYPIEVPPLRERTEDIEVLAEAFLRESERRLRKSFGKMPAVVIEALQDYSWPGNVRELENVISRAALISNVPRVQLPDGWSGHNTARTGEFTSTGRSYTTPDGVNTEAETTLDDVEKAYILSVLHQTNWRIEGPNGAALVLGMHPNTLRSRLSRLGIQKIRKPRGAAAETTKYRS